MALADDIFIAAAAAVTTATLVLLIATLVRYRAAVEDAGKSAQLAKDLWDSMNTRLSVQDARIIDLTAKVEVYSVRKAPTAASAPRPPAPQTQNLASPTPRAAESAPLPATRLSQGPESGEQRETQILAALASGPKSSREIKQIIDKTREHTARLMKNLYDRGLVVRNDRNKPYVYEITEAGRNYLNRPN